MMASPPPLSLSSSTRGNTSRPAVSASETPYASQSSDLTAAALSANNRPAQHQHQHPTSRPRNPSLSSRSRAFSSASSTSSSPVRRKPLPSTASPLATRFSPIEHLASTLELPEQSFTRPYSLDSPTLYEDPPTSNKPFSPSGSQTPPSTSQTTHQEHAPNPIIPSKQPPSHRTSAQEVAPKSPNLEVPPHQHQSITHARLTSESALSSASESTDPWYGDSSVSSQPYSTTMSIFSSKPTPPHKVTPNGPIRSLTIDSNESEATIQKSPLKSPGASKLGSFFGWGAGNISPASSSTFSDKAYSPIPSPQSPGRRLPFPNASNTTITNKNKPNAIDIPKANADPGIYFGGNLQLPLATPSTPSPIQVEEMEKELKDISSELAASIRREMDLEDLVDRLQSEAQNPSGAGKRTSDYFSDSGTSSVNKYGDSDPRQDELDRMQRRTEQEKAQMRLELTDKVQDERSKRKQLEAQIRQLEERASHVDLVSINSLDANGRLKDLEATCEDLRRRLAEERQVKDNFEDLLTALKGELQSSHNERDNLRDEIVPQLRARVEGLEAQATQHEKLTYEQTKMQQELQTLKTENTTLINAQRMQADMQHQMKKFNSIAEEGPRSSLSRSNSLSQAATRSRPGSLTRSASTKIVESREALADRVKDIELQRDSLHRALKSLLERQEHQNRENKKKIRQLEMERDKALSSSPRRLGYNKEVVSLREEINTLRRRADEAIEQKWQCEKGLSGLKMDLDRAEQEIGSLRSLLQEKDILLQTGRRPSMGRPSSGGYVSSDTLEKAYKDLQNAWVESLDRIKTLEISASKDEETEKAMRQLEKSLSDAISERDFAKRDVEALQEQSNSLRDSEKRRMGDEIALADELRNSAERVENLAAQVRQQLASNNTLRQRLAETIERGERDQKSNAQKITYMQSKLKTLEDQLMVAQQTSEANITRHEEEIRELNENHNVQLQRVKDGLRSPRLFSPKGPLSPMFANINKVPKLLATTSGSAVSVAEDTQMVFLKQRVLELEAALADADKEMEEVVGRMNIAQIEVMELQNEREEAVRETRRLQRKIEEERVKAFEGRFATLQS
ncbi:hypothetical protein B7494_g3209 [Chlorociboria aeruginascens]|nr:hypothetical protein B7494_g3209 [Chlorociboria aeruginascens]